MPARPDSTSPFAYAIVRLVPDLPRGEFVNAGVVLFARQHGFLEAKVGLGEERLAALAPDFDLAAARAALEVYRGVAAGAPDFGPMAALGQSERFGWLVAPSSTMVQTSPVHTGLCDDPARMLDELFDRLVLRG